MTTRFNLHYNKLCVDIPSEVAAVSSTGVGGWYVAEGNYLGPTPAACRRSWRCTSTGGAAWTSNNGWMGDPDEEKATPARRRGTA